MLWTLHSLIVFLLCAVLVAADLSSDLAQLKFKVLTPGSSGYSSASAAYNRRFTIQPAAVFFPASAADVSKVMQLAVKYNFPVVARGGGHSYIANGLGGKSGAFVVDMSSFNNVSVNASSNIAIIGSGNRLGDVALALNAKGRAMPHGTCPYVGIGGHSGQGGYGFTSRQWGLTLDTVVQLDVVLANGTIASASSTRNADLFWALRGASSSFSVVTAIHATTFVAPRSATVFEYVWDLSAVSASSAFESFQKYVQTPNLPAELGIEVILGVGSAKGRVTFEVLGAWYAPETQFNDIIQPFLATMPKPSSRKVTPGSYISSLTLLGGLGRLNTAGKPDQKDTFYAKSLMTPTNSPLSPAAIKAFMNFLANQGFGANTNWFVDVELFGGSNSAINRVPSTATAFSNRDSLFAIQFYSYARNDSPTLPSQGFGFIDAMVNSIISNSPSNWGYRAYANYIDDRLVNWQTLYYGTNYPRLQSIKRKYDPKNVIKFPLSIEG